MVTNDALLLCRMFNRQNTIRSADNVVNETCTVRQGIPPEPFQQPRTQTSFRIPNKTAVGIWDRVLTHRLYLIRVVR